MLCILEPAMDDTSQPAPCINAYHRKFDPLSVVAVRCAVCRRKAAVDKLRKKREEERDLLTQQRVAISTFFKMHDPTNSSPLREKLARHYWLPAFHRFTFCRQKVKLGPVVDCTQLHKLTAVPPSSYSLQVKTTMAARKPIKEATWIAICAKLGDSFGQSPNAYL